MESEDVRCWIPLTPAAAGWQSGTEISGCGSVPVQQEVVEENSSCVAVMMGRVQT